MMKPHCSFIFVLINSCMCFTLIILYTGSFYYDPDSQFNMSSLTRLEAAGIKVVTALQDNIDYLKTEIGLSTSQNVDSVQRVIEWWEEKRDNCPPITWRTWLDILSKVMSLRELNQIEEYLQYGEYNSIVCTLIIVSFYRSQ